MDLRRLVGQLPLTMGKKGIATVGVADHCGWAVLMTVAGDGTFLDRRRVALLDPALPALAHHHECQALPVAEAVALVARVTRSANAYAEASLEALAGDLSVKISGIALRACPPLPATVVERIADYRSQNVADSVMYRQALARAATARGWRVHWYDRKQVLAGAARALGRKSIEDLLETTGAALGPPWRVDHRIAMAAAISAS
jgi:hypothetical protein